MSTPLSNSAITPSPLPDQQLVGKDELVETGDDDDPVSTGREIEGDEKEGEGVADDEEEEEDDEEDDHDNESEKTVEKKREEKDPVMEVGRVDGETDGDGEGDADEENEDSDVDDEKSENTVKKVDSLSAAAAIATRNLHQDSLDSIQEKDLSNGNDDSTERDDFLLRIPSPATATTTAMSSSDLLSKRVSPTPPNQRNIKRYLPPSASSKKIGVKKSVITRDGSVDLEGATKESSTPSMTTPAIAPKTDKKILPKKSTLLKERSESSNSGGTSIPTAATLPSTRNDESSRPLRSSTGLNSSSNRTKSIGRSHSKSLGGISSSEVRSPSLPFLC